MIEIKWSQSPLDQWNLIWLKRGENFKIYKDHKDDAIISQMKKYRRLQKLHPHKFLGQNDRPEPYINPEDEYPKVIERNRKLEHKSPSSVLATINQDDRAALHQQLDDALAQYNLDDATVKSLKISKISRWDSLRNIDGETEKVPMYAIKMKIDPVDFEPKWPPITFVGGGKRLPFMPPTHTTAIRKAVILPDPQIPFHDPKALQVALNVAVSIKPDFIIFPGDLLDMSEWSRFTMYPEFRDATMSAITEAYQMLRSLRKQLPNTRIIVMEGNHEQRLPEYILKNNVAAYSLRPASKPKSWPSISVPALCSFDDIGIEYIPGYPANKFWLNERLQVVHGTKASGRQNEAKMVVNDERVTTIFTHAHRISSYYKTVEVYGGARTNAAYNPGCLCLINGHVPSTKSGRDLEGKPLESYENWQHGFAVVEYEEGDRPFHYEQVYINTFNGYEAFYRGKIYKP